MRWSLTLAAVPLFALVSAVQAATTDLREFRVGMTDADLPSSGYTGFACAADPKISLAGWRDWQKCPADDKGLHAVRFRYSEGETEVAGHPVLLTLLLAAPGQVEGLRIETDPAARLYLRKKAFLLGLQARSRYGEEGWTCTEGAPGADAQPIGTTFVEERCDKTLDGKRIVIERDLFRRPDQPLKTFVGDTRITVLRSR